MRPVPDVEGFLALSASIHYQLSATPPNWDAILALALEERHEGEERALLIATLDFLREAYGETRRKLGPNAILHPIRVLALLRREGEELTPRVVVSTLLHDLREDVTPARRSTRWKQVEEGYRKLLALLDDADAEAVDDWIETCTRVRGERYYQYLGRLLSRAHEVPVLIPIKLADRLDNTLDLRLDLQDPATVLDAPRALFDLLFTDNPWPAEGAVHPVPGRLNGSQRLYQLFKNAVFLSLLRKEGLDQVDEPSSKLFLDLATASVDEAERNLLHVFTYHLTDRTEQRALVRDVMQYCNSGAINQVTPAGAPHDLDGLFDTRMDRPTKKSLRQELGRVYGDKVLMAKIALAFGAMFTSFLRDPDFLIRGIDTDGFHPEEM